MEVVNKKLVLVVIIIGIISSIFIWQSISDKETKLEIVSLNKETKTSSMFAIMLEQEDGTYKESEENIWPTSSIYKYDDIRSGCMDPNGNKIENALTYDEENKIASVETSNTSYCYLYFSIPKICETGTQIGECLLENPTLALNINMEGGLYRYQGSVADNYICFGTSDIDECLNNKDKYLYRIIGIDENNRLKLIKNTLIGRYVWYGNSTSENIKWSESDLFKGLNGVEQENITPIFIDNSTYDYMEIDNEWYNKIANVEWKYGDTTSNGNYNAEIIYEIENSWVDTVNAKIGLMYIHDYYYAYEIGGNPENAENAIKAWINMYTCAGVSGNVVGDERLISRYGLDGSFYRAWVIRFTGVSSNYGAPYAYISLNAVNSVRPVFFLTYEVKYKSGLGTQNFPILLN